ncbi:hypothetical protein NDU88_002638 [Pleurodeles waltl]|uniref:Uncharacterized protein n=1 Tax=Pleurodeles waltl TaxID=8319 RepID=A0AAV7UW69_PLEWA|nr:hypothetical protein NDU88_002638 [Pleurodeles waltl]
MISPDGWGAPGSVPPPLRLSRTELLLRPAASIEGRESSESACRLTGAFCFIGTRHGSRSAADAMGETPLLKFLKVALLEGGKALLKYKEIHIPLGENTQPDFAEQETYDVLQASQGKATTPPVDDAGNSSHIAQTSEAGVEANGTKKKVPDWPKDEGDKFYSLTEDSDSTNSDQSSSETGASISSELGSFSSLAESTVRQRRRESKGLKVRAPIREGVELSAQSRKTLKWDYSGTKLLSTAEAHIPETQAKAKGQCTGM